MLKVLDKCGVGFAALLIASVSSAEVTQNGQAVTAGDDSAQLAEVVVTAEKRSESVQDVAAAVTVLGAADLDKLQATDLVDHASYVSGLQVDSSKWWQRWANTAIRGPRRRIPADLGSLPPAKPVYRGPRAVLIKLSS